MDFEIGGSLARYARFDAHVKSFMTCQNLLLPRRRNTFATIFRRCVANVADVSSVVVSPFHFRITGIAVEMRRGVSEECQSWRQKSAASAWSSRFFTVCVSSFQNMLTASKLYNPRLVLHPLHSALDHALDFTLHTL